MQALINGTDPGLHSAWSKLNDQLYEAFHEHLQPMFIVRDPLDLAAATNQMEIDGLEVISLDEESPVLDRGQFDPAPRFRAPEPKQEPQLGSPKRHVNGAEKHRGSTEELPNPFVSASFQSYRLKVSIGDIRNTLGNYSKPGAPGHIDFRAKDELCMKSVKVWERPIERYLDIVLEMMRHQATGILDQVLSKWRQTELYKESFTHLEEFFALFETSLRETCSDILNLEFYKLFTINKRSFLHYMEAEMKKIKDARRTRRAKVLAEQLMRGVHTRGDSTARRHAILQKTKAIKDEELGEDPFRTEVEVAALVRGYYLTAADRVCDQICLTIHGSLFKQAHDKIFRYLESSLGLDKGNSKVTSLLHSCAVLTDTPAEERCRELMEEDTRSAQRRRGLQQEKAKLEKFTARLLKLAADDRSASVFEPHIDTLEVDMGIC